MTSNHTHRLLASRARRLYRVQRPFTAAAGVAASRPGPSGRGRAPTGRLAKALFLPVLLSCLLAAVAFTAWALLAFVTVLPAAIGIPVWVVLTACVLQVWRRRAARLSAGLSERLWRNQQIRAMRAMSKAHSYVPTGKLNAMRGIEVRRARAPYSPDRVRGGVTAATIKLLRRTFFIGLVTLVAGSLMFLAREIWCVSTLLPTAVAMPLLAALMTFAIWQHFRDRMAPLST